MLLSKTSFSFFCCCLVHSTLSIRVPPESVQSGKREGDEDAKDALLRQRRRRINESFLSPKLLILLLQFPEHADKELPSREYFEEMCTNEMKPYFEQQSYGHFNITCDVRPWMTAEYGEDFYAQNKSGLLGSRDTQKFFHSALNAMDFEAQFTSGSSYWDQYDVNSDGLLDSVLVLHSGYAAEFGVDCTNNRTSKERITSQGHARYVKDGWESSDATGNMKLAGYAIASGVLGRCGSNPAKMGVPTHELIHTFGEASVPDLYDVTTPGLAGVGGYDIMASPFGSSGRNGDAPGSMSPWTKKFVGWAEPTEICNDGVYSMRPSTSASDYYIINKRYADNEYLLLEYRRPVDFDKDFYGDGMVVYHVDDEADLMRKRGFPGQEGWPENGNHYRIAVLQADGLYDLENSKNIGDAGDLWTPGMSIGPGDGSTFPNTDSYQGGNIIKTGITITVLTMDETTLTFEVDGLGQGACDEETSISDGTAVGPTTPTDPASSDNGGYRTAGQGTAESGGFIETSSEWIITTSILMPLLWIMFP